MTNLHDTGYDSEQLRRPSGELPIQRDGAAWTMLTHNMLAAFLDYPPDALIVVDETGTIVLLNTQTETLFGYGRDELTGQPVELLLPEHLRAAHAVLRAHYMQAPRTRQMGIGLDLVGQRKDGSQFPVEISLQPIQIEHTLHVIAAIRDMTAHREAERERVRIFQRLRQQDKLLNMAHDAILVRDPENRIVSWNKGAERLYGWTAQQVMGKVTHTLLQTRFSLSQEEVDHILEQDGQWQGELIHTCQDKRQVIVESHQVLMRDEQGAPSAILEINRDVTERHHLERLEREARAEVEAHLQVLQMILDRLPTGVFLVQGPHERLLMANQAAADSWGSKWLPGQLKEEFFQQHQIQLLTPSGRQLTPDEWIAKQVLASGEPVFQYQLVIRRADGTRFPVQVNALPLGTFSPLPSLLQGTTLQLPEAEPVALLVYQDVSALKEAEVLKDQFISLAAHELRTPVTIIAGYADRLLSPTAQGKGHVLDEWQREKVQEMKQASWQLANLTEDLLDVARMQAGQFKLEQRLTDLVALTRRMVRRFQATTDWHRLAFQTTLPQLQAMVDASRIEQVLSNLLSNAIRYSPGGGPIEVTLEEHMEPHEARFSIRDQGMGVPRAQQAHLFERFVRGENVRAAGIRGTGLGLPLCWELIERHGGRISFESEEGVGSTFFFSLPCSKVVQQEKGNGLHEKTDPASPSS